MISLFKALFKASKAAMRIKNRSFYEKSGFIFITSGMFGQTFTYVKKDAIAIRSWRKPLWLMPFGLMRLRIKMRGKNSRRINLYLSRKRRYLNTPI